MVKVLSLATLLSLAPSLFVGPYLLAADTPAKSAENNTIVLDEKGVQNLRIETEPVEERDFEQTAFSLGRIEAIPRNSGTLSSRIPGRIVELSVTIGDMVEAGTVVAKVESRQPGDPPPVITLKAPVRGMITRMDTRIGDPVEPDKILMEITDLREVYAIARVPEHLAGKMKAPAPGTNAGVSDANKARITVTALPKEKFEGTLLRFGTSADRENGTLDAVFRMGNPGGLLRPEMRAEFSIILGRRTNILSIPRSALQGEAANRFVYVKDFNLPRAFIKTPVVVGEMNDRYVEIISGLFAADEVVTRGSYSLGFVGTGSMSLKDALDAAHGHEHAADGSELTPAKKAEMEAKKAKEKGGNAAAQPAAAAGNSDFWMYTSAGLFALLLISLLFRSGPENKDESKEQDTFLATEDQDTHATASSTKSALSQPHSNSNPELSESAHASRDKVPAGAGSNSKSGGH